MTYTAQTELSKERLTSFIERIERMEAEKAALAEDIKEIYSEVKSVGYDTAAVKKIIALRKMDAEKRQEAEAILEVYKSVVGL